MSRALARISAVIVAALSIGVGESYAQSPVGYGSIITLPVVVNTSTFTSEIYIHNPSSSLSVTVDPWYYGGDGTATVGFVNCFNQVVGPNETVQISLTALCPLNAGSNFGRLRLYEINADNRPFTAYARVNAFSGNGFSIEAFPVGNFGFPNSTFYVNGLKRTAAGGGAPAYQTNCFIGALQEAVEVTWSLRNGTTNALLGGTQVTTLGASQFVRILDVFTAVGAPAGDHTNVRAQFTESTGPTQPAFVAFCTVQNNSSFDADFRIAKVNQANNDDAAKNFTTSVAFSSGVTVDGGGNLLPAPSTFGLQHEWAVFLQHPDWVACSTSGVVPSGSLEMQLVDPQGNVVAGGSDLASFGETFLGEKNVRNSGRNGLWHVEVGDNGNGPVTAYTPTCTSGNGASAFVYHGATGDNF